MITSTVYTDELVLKEAGDGGSEISTLGEPVALIGQEAVKRLGIPDGKIKLENNSEQVATVHVIVGWDAVEDSDE